MDDAKSCYFCWLKLRDENGWIKRTEFDSFIVWKVDDSKTRQGQSEVNSSTVN
jgi:hypothetical protein